MWTFEWFYYYVLGIIRWDDANGVFDAGEELEARFAGILCMRWFWEVRKGLAWTLSLC